MQRSRPVAVGDIGLWSGLVLRCVAIKDGESPTEKWAPICHTDSRPLGTWVASSYTTQPGVVDLATDTIAEMEREISSLLRYRAFLKSTLKEVR